MKTWNQQREAERALRLKWLTDVSKSGLCCTAAGRKLGLRRDSLHRMLKEAGLSVDAYKKEPAKNKGGRPLPVLNKKQMADYRTLMDHGYTRLEALESIGVGA